MIITKYVCNNCNKETENYVSENWIKIKSRSNDLEILKHGSHQLLAEMHFCSIQCLHDWFKKEW